MLTQNQKRELEKWTIEVDRKRRTDEELTLRISEKSKLASALDAEIKDRQESVKPLRITIGELETKKTLAMNEFVAIKNQLMEEKESLAKVRENIQLELIKIQDARDLIMKERSVNLALIQEAKQLKNDVILGKAEIAEDRKYVSSIKEAIELKRIESEQKLEKLNDMDKKLKHAYDNLSEDRALFEFDKKQINKEREVLGAQLVELKSREMRLGEKIQQHVDKISILDQQIFEYKDETNKTKKKQEALDNGFKALETEKKRFLTEQLKMVKLLDEKNIDEALKELKAQLKERI